MGTRDDKPRRGGRFLVGLGVLSSVVALTAFAMTIFGLGILSGLAVSGGVVLVYVIPASMCGWPLPSLDDIFAVFTGIVGVIVAIVLSIFD